MADFDLDAVEELIAQDKQKPTEESTKLKKEYSSRRREHSQDSNDRRKPNKDEKKRYRSRHGSRSNSQDSALSNQSQEDRHYRKKHHRDNKPSHRSRGDRGKRHGSSDSGKGGALANEKNAEAEELKRREEALAKSLEEAKRQAEEAQRDDCTVLVSRIHLAVDEKELFIFFSKAKVGKIRDVRLIRDQRSGKSKGIAYVEFYTPESVLMAMAMSGQQLNGQTLMVQASQAEKNRQAAATKFKKQDAEQEAASNRVNTLAPQYHHARREQNNRVYVGGLVGTLGALTDLDIRKFFEPFGLIDAIDLPRDSQGKNQGHAIIEFRSHRDAKIAVKSMHNFEATEGLKLSVSIIMDSQQANQDTLARNKGREEELGEDTTNTYIHSAEARSKLMQQLMSRNGQKGEEMPLEAPKPQPQREAQAQPSNCLLFTNLFDVKQVDLRKDPSFFIDIKDQVIQACNSFGPVDKVYIEQDSEGHVWVKFKTSSSEDPFKAPIGCQMAMHKQYFDSRLIQVSYVPEVLFTNKFKER